MAADSECSVCCICVWLLIVGGGVLSIAIVVTVIVVPVVVVGSPEDTADCGSAPTAPSNGRLVSNTGTTVGATATYACDTGYDVIGTPEVTCHSNGRWEDPPGCQIKDCGTVPSAPTNGKLLSNNGSTYGSSATYACDTGYDVIGNTVITCQANSSWQNPPECQSQGSSKTCVNTSEGVCPSDWTLREENNICYFVVKTLITWEEAQTCCLDLCAELLEIPDDQVLQFLPNITRNRNYWIGAEYNNGSYTWLTGAGNVNDSFIFKNTTPDPDICLAYRKPVEIIKGFSCTETYFTICQTSLT